jgi:hypothetical protein
MSAALSGSADMRQETTLSRSEPDFGRLRLLALSAYYLLNVPFAANWFSVALTAPLFLIVCFAVVRIRSPYVRMADMLWFCIYLFFVIGPVQAMGLDGVIGEVGRARIPYSANEYVVAMAIVVLFVTPLYMVPQGSLEVSDVTPSSRRLTILFAVNIATAITFVFTEGGLANLLAARLEQAAADKFIGSLLFLGFQSVSAAMFVAEVRAGKRDLRWMLPTLIVIGLLVLTRNPFNAPRFMLVAAWLPILVVLLRGKVSIGWFYLFCMLALTVALPILSATSRLGVQGLDAISSLDFGGYALHVPFVDLFDTLVHAVRFVDVHGFDWGTKTLAVLLFFVPRPMWPDKPIVGGLDIGYELYYSGFVGTPNLSFLLGGDFYLDFGLPGVAILSMITAWLVARLTSAKFGSPNGVPILRMIFLASLPILIRGPVGAILPLFSCQVAAIWMLGPIVNLGLKSNATR